MSCLLGRTGVDRAVDLIRQALLLSGVLFSLIPWPEHVGREMEEGMSPGARDRRCGKGLFYLLGGDPWVVVMSRARKVGLVHRSNLRRRIVFFSCSW